jgi:hypothetical protein
MDQSHFPRHSSRFPTSLPTCGFQEFLVRGAEDLPAPTRNSKIKAYGGLGGARPAGEGAVAGA